MWLNKARLSLNGGVLQEIVTFIDMTESLGSLEAIIKRKSMYLATEEYRSDLDIHQPFCLPDSKQRKKDYVIKEQPLTSTDDPSNIYLLSINFHIINI